MALHNLTKNEMDRLKEILAKAEEDHAWLDELASDKRSAYDDKSDKYKEGDNGTAAETLIEALEQIRDNLDTFKDDLSGLDGIND